MSSYGDVRQLNNYDGAPGPIIVASTTTVYSRAIRINYGQVFGIWYQAANGSGSANMKIQIEQSYKVPTTEGSSDAAWVIPLGVQDINTNLADTTAHIQSLSPVPMKYIRLKITGLGSNPADATLNFWIFIQEIIT